MSLNQQVFAIHLMRLFGKNAVVSDVVYTEADIQFSLPVDAVQDFPHGVNVTIYGIEKGRLICSINEISLEGQLAFVNALAKAAKKRDPQHAS
ncbi:hypothetical protein [Spirosoma sp.]|uniref:hypothetical protein n=1 Tax=Spirosoma sp. TaxID=1899569 RepID=UPI00262B3170|nr:hypothetical protein [Spirosoma sp.]MCX6218312.1 hypothetical protein [Spirosoma sp.]